MSFAKSKPAKLGCSLVVGLLAVFGCIFGILFLSCSNFFAEMMGEETFALSGDTRRFDPFAKLAEIRSHIPAEARLVSISATFVRSDGTMDLQADYVPFPQTEYVFHLPLAKAPDNAPPVGAGRGPDDTWYQEIQVKCWKPGQMRRVSKTSGSTRTTYSYRHLGIEVDRRDPQSGKPTEGIPAPKCSTQKLWEIAISKGADRNAVARIEYGAEGYDFRIDRTDVRFECDADCRVKVD